MTTVFERVQMVFVNEGIFSKEEVTAETVYKDDLESIILPWVVHGLSEEFYQKDPFALFPLEEFLTLSTVGELVDFLKRQGFQDDSVPTG